MKDIKLEFLQWLESIKDSEYGKWLVDNNLYNKNALREYELLLTQLQPNVAT